MFDNVVRLEKERLVSRRCASESCGSSVIVPNVLGRRPNARFGNSKVAPPQYGLSQSSRGSGNIDIYRSSIFLSSVSVKHPLTFGPVNMDAILDGGEQTEQSEKRRIDEVVDSC